MNDEGRLASGPRHQPDLSPAHRTGWRSASALERVIRAREALEDGDLGLVDAILRDLEDYLTAEQLRWVDVSALPLVADMSVFEDERRDS